MPNYEARVAELGLSLPDSPAPIANYIPAVVSGNILFLSGVLGSGKGGERITGKLGADFTVQEGYDAARMSAIGHLARIRAAVGSLDRVSRIIKLNGFVACTPDFIDHPAVVNGASDLLVEVFGENGKHARSAVGVPSLPLDAPVEIELVIELVS
jgi:enamine deaminase RidA (YjgF/YER057c/UK114 family)